jgi:hypothetical protein
VISSVKKDNVANTEWDMTKITLSIFYTYELKSTLQVCGVKYPDKLNWHTEHYITKRCILFICSHKVRYKFEILKAENNEIGFIQTPQKPAYLVCTQQG